MKTKLEQIREEQLKKFENLDIEQDITNPANPSSFYIAEKFILDSMNRIAEVAREEIIKELQKIEDEGSQQERVAVAIRLSRYLREFESKQKEKKV